MNNTNKMNIVSLILWILIGIINLTTNIDTFDYAIMWIMLLTQLIARILLED